MINMLNSPLRTPLPYCKQKDFLIYFLNLENWSPKEIAIFLNGICLYGKRFDKIAKSVSFLP